MVGLAARAGKVIYGTAACEKGLNKGKIKLLLMQNGLSDRSVNHLVALCNAACVEYIVVDERLGIPAGKEGIMVIGITDYRFAKRIKQIFECGSGR